MRVNLELLVMIVIISILTAFTIPTYLSYTKKMHYLEVVQAVNSYKPMVESCYQLQGGGRNITACGEGKNELLQKSYSVAGNIASIVIKENGVIIGQDKTLAVSYILTPKPVRNTLIWEVSGSCKNVSAC